MLGKRRSIAEDDELHPGAGDCYIHSAQVIQETDLPVLIGTHEANEDDIAFLPLETIQATATLTGIEGRKLTFSIKAEDSKGVIGEATHVRYIVDREKFMSKL